MTLQWQLQLMLQSHHLLPQHQQLLLKLKFMSQQMLSFQLMLQLVKSFQLQWKHAQVELAQQQPQLKNHSLNLQLNGSHLR
jgi:hypothetical protein